jgi:hypothetical protein
MFNIFQTPWPLLGVAAVLLVAVEVYRQIRPERASYLLFLIPAVTGLLALGCDYIVKTDREKVRESFNSTLEAVINQDLKGLQKTISDDYRDKANDSKQELMRFAAKILKKPSIEKFRKSYLNMEIDKDKALLSSQLVVYLNENGYYGFAPEMVIVKFEFDLIEEEGVWRILESRLLEINRQSYDWGDLKAF